MTTIGLAPTLPPGEWAHEGFNQDRGAMVVGNLGAVSGRTGLTGRSHRVIRWYAVLPRSAGRDALQTDWYCGGLVLGAATADEDLEQFAADCARDPALDVQTLGAVPATWKAGAVARAALPPLAGQHLLPAAPVANWGGTPVQGASPLSPMIAAALRGERPLAEAADAISAGPSPGSRPDGSARAPWLAGGPSGARAWGSAAPGVSCRPARTAHFCPRALRTAGATRVP